MKKFIIGLTAITLCVTLSACGNSQTNASITSLSNQLDETSNTISTMQTVNPSDITLTKSMLDTISSEDSSNAVYDNIICTQNALLNEQYYKTDILNKTAKIKNCLSKDIKLSKTQASAIKDLTKSLGKYTNSISYTKNELNSSVKAIASMKKNVAKNSDKINAKLNRIACNSNSRSSYYENVLQTLDEIDDCLKLNCGSNSESEVTENNSTELEQNETDSPLNDTKQGLTKNIDTYLSNDDQQNSQTNDKTEQDNEVQNPTQYNNVYNRYNRYNMTRNIDTYAPFNRNIDSLGRYGYGRYGYRNLYPYAPYGDPYMTPYANPYGMQNGLYGENLYNSNNINRMQNAAYANTENDSPRLENFEEVKDGIVEEVTESEENSMSESKQECKNCDFKNEREVETEVKIKPVGNFNDKYKRVKKHEPSKDNNDDIVIAY